MGRKLHSFRYRRVLMWLPATATMASDEGTPT
jgi:hypothetical protein